MKIGVFGTGMVGNAIATKLVQVGHDVRMGSRSAGNEKAVAWVKATSARASEGTFADAAAFSELLFNCTSIDASLASLQPTGTTNLDVKILINVSNTLAHTQLRMPNYVCK